MSLRGISIFRFCAVTICSLFFTLASFGQTEHVLHSFRAGVDGSIPSGSLVADASGNLYGATTEGGGSIACGWSNHVPIGCGTIFELVPPQKAGGAWTESVIYAFQAGTAGGGPSAPLVIDHTGNLYGSTPTGGAQDYGEVFELSPPAVQGGAWTFTTLYSYSEWDDGFNPNGVFLDSAGNLYGEVYGYPNTEGNIFELSPPSTQGNPWTYTLVYTFNGIGDGGWPRGSLVFDPQGNLYGATNFGGESCPWNQCGTVFKLTKPSTAGGAWTEQTLHTFTGGDDGGQPYGGVVFHNGKLYGTTTIGGADLGGTAFELSQSEGGDWTFNTIFTFNVDENASGPYSGALFDAEGNFYGTAENTVGQGDTSQIYKLSPPAAPGGNWTYQNLYTFSSCTDDGCGVYANVIFGSSNRYLFGVASGGGKGAHGAAYEIVQ
jgi:hypothetical protein